jgi:hypothetical protein
MSARYHAVAQRLRARRMAREFDRAVRTASPAVREELLAAAARSDLRVPRQFS